MESKLEQAERHVRRGREIILAQRDRIVAIQERGEDAVEARSLLLQYEKSQAIFEADLEDIRRRAAAG